MNSFQLPESNAMERIRLHYTEDRELSESDMKIKDRWETAHSLLISDSENKTNSAKILSKKFGITITCAYNDIRNAQNLFGNVHTASKQAMRHMISEWCIDLHRMAKTIKNFKSVEKAIERFTKANNLDKEDQDIIDAAKIQPPVQLLSVNFNFINSPMFKLIDESAQKALLQLYDEFMAQVKLSPLADYTDMFKIDDSVRNLKK
jgi:hypothetical protein